MTSSKQQRNWWMIMNITGLFLLPGLSIYIATRSHLLYENFTYVGNQSAYRPIFLTWGILLSMHMLVTFIALLKITHNQHASYILLVSILGILHGISYVLPYNKDTSLLASELHVYISIATFIGYILLLLLYMYRLHNFYLFITTVKAMITLLVAMFFSLMLTGDISSVVELINTNYMSIFMLYLLKKTKRYQYG